VLELTRVPNYTTLARTFAKLSLKQWERLNDALLRHLQVKRERVRLTAQVFATIKPVPINRVVVVAWCFGGTREGLW